MTDALTTPQTASFRLRAGSVRARTDVSVTPAGLLAIGALVAAILLSVPPIVRAARVERAAPPDARLSS